MKCPKCDGPVTSITRVELRSPGREDVLAEALNRCLRCGYVSVARLVKVPLRGVAPVNNLFDDCPRCGEPVILSEERVVRGRGRGRIWVCAGYPKCDTRVGCHPDTSLPMGTPAGPDLRRWRGRVHEKLDALWKSGLMKRQRAYDWLAGEMGLDGRRCHVGHFSFQQCMEAEKLCSERLRKET